MLKIFDNPEYISEKEVIRKYPHSRYILKDIKDVNNVAGQLLAVSTDRESFKNVGHYYWRLKRCYYYPSIHILVGNKCDLYEQREINQEEINECIEKYGYNKYYEISVKTGECVYEMFEDIINMLFNK